MRLYYLLCFLSLLAGCAEQRPHAFGIPLSEWNHASETERQDLIGQYNVNKLPHYPTEPIVTMSSTAATPTSKPDESLSILGEDQKTTVQAVKPEAPKDSTAAEPTENNTDDNSWLRLND